MSQENLKILIADRHAVFLHSLANHLADKGHEIIAQVDSFEEILSTVKEYTCDVVISDCQLNHSLALNTLIQLKRHHPNTRVIFLTGNNTPLLFDFLIQADIDGLIDKAESREEIIHAITHSNKQYVSPSIAPKKSSAVDLTTKEQQILELLLSGMNNTEISNYLSKSTGTINIHRNNIMHKFKAHNIIELTQRCQTLGFFDP